MQQQIRVHHLLQGALHTGPTLVKLRSALCCPGRMHRFRPAPQLRMRSSMEGSNEGSQQLCYRCCSAACPTDLVYRMRCLISFAVVSASKQMHCSRLAGDIVQC